MMTNPNKLLLSVIWLLLFSCNQQGENPGSEENTITDFEGLIPINGTELYVKVMGSGEPMVILHGGPGLDHSYFLPHLEFFADDYQLIFYDQRGGGQSSIELDTASMTMSNFVEDLEGIRKHFNFTKMHIMSHSFGGLISMHYAIQYPDNLKSMILVGSVAPTSELMQSASLMDAANVTPEDSIEFSEIISSEAMANGEPEAIEKLMRLSFKRQFFDRKYMDSLNLSITERFMTTNGLLTGLQQDLIDFDLTEPLGNIPVPVLIIYGDKEATYQVSDDILYEAIPNAQNWVIRDCGHLPFIEKKQDFRRIVHNFLASVE